MKKATKSVKLITTLTLLVLAFFSVINVTYSYFTASAKSNGTLNFPDMQVNFVYLTNETSSPNVVTTSTLTLYPVEEVSTGVYDSCAISRGNSFLVSLTEKGAPIRDLGIKNSATSCESYVRFWIDAYIVNSSGSIISNTNYGKYFLLPTNRFYTNTGSSVAGSWCYFTEYAMSSNYEIDFGNSITFAEDAPVELLGKKLKITISFEAVQKANEAYLSVFGKTGDTKGYYTLWGTEDE